MGTFIPSPGREMMGEKESRECKGGEASDFAASPQPYLGEARGHPIRTVPGELRAGCLSPAAPGAHRRARPSRPQPLIRPGPGQGSEGCAHHVSRASWSGPPAPARRSRLTRWPSCSWGSPGAPGTRGSEARVRSVAREDDHQHRGSLQGRLETTASFVVLGVRPEGEGARQPPRSRAQERSSSAQARGRGRPCSGPWRAAGRPGADARGRRRGAEEVAGAAYRYSPSAADPPAAAAAPPRLAAGALEYLRPPALAWAPLADSSPCGCLSRVRRKVPSSGSALYRGLVAFFRGCRCTSANGRVNACVW